MRVLPPQIAELLFRDERRLALHRRLADTVLADDLLRVADVGSRGGVPEELAPIADHIALLGVEPDAQEARHLSDSARAAGLAHRFLPIAVAAAEGTRTLYVTRKPELSSLLPPEPETFERFPYSDRAEVVEEMSVQTRPFGAVLSAEGFAPEVVKCDAQGLDGEILGSLDAAQWPGVLAVHVEINIARHYRGGATLGEMHGLLEEHGLELFSVRRYSSTRAGFDPARFVSRGQLTELDALYMRPEQAVDGDARKRLAVVAATYRHFDHALALLRDVDPPAASIVERIATRRFTRSRALLAMLADAAARLGGSPPSAWNADGPRDWV